MIILLTHRERTTTNCNYCTCDIVSSARRKTKTREKNYPVGWNGGGDDDDDDNDYDNENENDVTLVTVLRTFGNCVWNPRSSSARGVLSLLILLLFLTAVERTHPWWLEIACSSIAPSMCWGVTVIAPVRPDVFETESKTLRTLRFGGKCC